MRDAVIIPAFIGSRLTADNIEKYSPVADAFIVGSDFKFDGSWKNEVDKDRVKVFMQKVNRIR